MATVYESTLLDLANHIGLPSPELLPDTQELIIGDHAVGFAFDAHDVNEPVAGDILFFCTLGNVAAEREVNLYRLLLEANNLWSGTGGATLGMQRDTGMITLSARLPLEGLEAPHFAEVLDAFADTADFWSGVLAGDNIVQERSDINLRV